MFPISNSLNYLKQESTCCIKRKELVLCISCGINNETDNSLILIKIEMLKLESLNAIIKSLVQPFSSSCITYSFNPNETIKDNIFTCKQEIIKESEIPHLIFFIVDLSTENDLDSKQYINLINLKKSYKKIIEDEFTYNNKTFILSRA